MGIIERNLDKVDHTPYGADMAYDLLILGSGSFEEDYDLEDMRFTIGKYEILVEKNHTSYDKDMAEIRDWLNEQKKPAE